MRTSVWIKENVRESAELHPEILDVVSDFTLMWALFEASEGDNNNIVEQITSLSQRVAHEMPIAAIDILLLLTAASGFFFESSLNSKYIEANRGITVS